MRCVLLTAPLMVLPVACYATLRLLYIQPRTEGGMSDCLTSWYFICTAAVCYFTGVLRGMTGRMGDYWRWALPALLMVLLAADESFMIHENLTDQFGIPELTVYGTYGLILLAVLVLFRRSRPDFWVFIALFFVLCGTSQLNDSTTGREGMVTVAGRGIDYEQILEMFGAMALVCAFGSAAAKELMAARTTGAAAHQKSNPAVQEPDRQPAAAAY